MDPRRSGHACSVGQEAVWFAEQAGAIGAANNLPVSLTLRGALDVERLTEALRAVVRAHGALRTRFTEREGRLERTELRHAEVGLERVSVDPSELDAAIEERSRAPLDLLAAPHAIALLSTAPDHHVLWANFHHAIFDGPSKDIFVRDLATAYRTGADLPVRSDYGAYVEHERRQAAMLEADAGRYWRPILSEIRGSLRFPGSAHPGPARGESLRFRIDTGLKRRLDALAADHGVSLFVVLAAAVQLLHHIYAGRGDGGVALAIPLGTRPERMRDHIGMFVNEALLYAAPAPDLTFAAFLRQVAGRLRELSRLRLYPFTWAVARFAPGDDPRTYAPQVGISYWKTSGTDPDMGPLAAAVDRLSPVYGRRWAARFRLLERPGDVLACFEYDGAFMHDAAARRAVEHIETLLRSAANDPDRRLARFSALPPQERTRLTVEWAGPAVDYGAETIQGLIEAQVERTPDRIAVECEGRRLTYRELNTRANRLAHRLIAARATLVGLYLERGLALAVAVLGVLKAGAAHVPLDPDYPAERLAFMLDDADAALVVTERRLVGSAPIRGRRVLCVDDGGGEAHDPPVTAGPDSLAYVIFTSGSTGRPKGAGLLHRGLHNLIRTMAREPGLEQDDVFLSVTTLSFDIGTAELLAPLTVGARVVIAPADTAGDGTALTELLRTSGATVMFGTPSRWRLLLNAGWEGPQRVIVGGEALSSDLARELVARSRAVWNIYGPTETTIFSTCGRIEDPARVTIGRPVANTRVFVLDAAGQLLPTGLPGELCIAGAGLVRGYLKRPELTRERFVDDPAYGRYYRSGDLVRWLDDGRLEFLGRIDDQVKIRGFRVEPGEVEAALARLPGVRRAAVIAREDVPGEKRLVAYLVVSGEAPGARGLREELAQRLPAYMLPSAFVWLDELPLSPNGKLDRVRLPAPDVGSEPGRDHVPPRTPLERRLAAVWAEVLGVDRVGVYDDFFELGGHSLLAAELVGRIRGLLGRQLPLRIVFTAPTIAQMAGALTEEAPSPPIGRAVRQRL